jgi:hypothetical protein
VTITDPEAVLTEIEQAVAYVDDVATCPHLNFETSGHVQRFVADGAPQDGPAVAFIAEVQVRCAVCHVPFVWENILARRDPRRGPSVTGDRLQLTTQIAPSRG